MEVCTKSPGTHAPISGKAPGRLAETKSMNLGGEFCGVIMTL